MHTRLLITSPAAYAASSAEARRYVYNVLANAPASMGDGDRFGNGPVCDWFVIGGCFSGSLVQENGDIPGERDQFCPLG